MNIREILKSHRKVCVVGISANPERPSNWISHYLLNNGYEVIGVNPGMPLVQGVQVVASLSEVSDPLEIVNVFRSPDAIASLVEELAIRKPKVLWLQPGAQNPKAEQRARELGMTVISGPCIYEEHRAL